MNSPVESGHLFDPAPVDLPEELCETLASGAGPVRIERIVSRGHRSPEGYWYDQEQDEWVVVLKGSAVLRWDDGGKPTTALAPGDWLKIPARCRHRVEATEGDADTVWLAVFFG